MIDLSVRAAYLILTLGRGKQTLGEEYTDITPYASNAKRMPGKAVCRFIPQHLWSLD